MRFLESKCNVDVVLLGILIKQGCFFPFEIKWFFKVSPSDQRVFMHHYLRLRLFDFLYSKSALNVSHQCIALYQCLNIMHRMHMNNVCAGCQAQTVAVGASAIAEPQRYDPISVPGIQHLRNPKHYQMRPRKKWRGLACVY